MIGYYAHHQGRGHQQRAALLARHLTRTTGESVTVLSSATAPLAGGPGWVVLPRDDTPGPGNDPTAHGHLHWVPRHHPGLRRRTAALSAWLDAHDVRLLVSDVSQEVAVLARLHGVPVVSVVLPGDRGDAAHRLGLGVSDALVGFWPPAEPGMVRGLAPADRARLHAVGGLSRLAPAPRRRTPRPTVVVLDSRGGAGFDPAALECARAETPGWDWLVLGGPTWTPDPGPALGAADVVVCHAGQSSVAEVAAAGVPAIVVPEDRPHDEQRTTARVLDSGRWPALVEPDWPLGGWPERLAAAAALDGSSWAGWSDGRAAERFAKVVADVLAPVRAAS